MMTMKHPWEIMEAIKDLKKHQEAILANIALWEKKDREVRDMASRELLKSEEDQDWTIVNNFGNSYHAARDSLELEYSETEAKIKTLQWVLSL